MYVCVGESENQVVVGNKAIQSRRRSLAFSSLLEVSTTTTSNTTSHFFCVKLAIPTTILA